MSVHETQYGFVHGPAEVTRMATLPDGSVCIRVAGSGGRAVDVYVSPAGRSVRVFGKSGDEWKPAPTSQGRCPTPGDCRNGEPCMLAAGCSNDPRKVTS